MKEHKSRIIEKNWKSRKKYTKHEKILRTRNCRRKFIKDLLPEKRN